MDEELQDPEQPDTDVGDVHESVDGPGDAQGSLRLSIDDVEEYGGTHLVSAAGHKVRGQLKHPES